MDKRKLLISVLLLVFSAIIFIVGAIFVAQNIGMCGLLGLGALGVVFGIVFLGMTMSDGW